MSHPSDPSSAQKSPSSPPVSLRPATDDDLDAVLSIEKEWNPTPWTREGFAAELDKAFSRFWVLTDDETDEVVVGYIVFHVVGDHGQIQTVAVHPKFQKVGFGQRLTREAIKESIREGNDRMTLDVRKSNAAALALYQAIGFTISRVVKSYYADGEDGYSMEISIKEDGIRF